MPDYLLAAPEGYDSSSQAMVGLMAASFDDQFGRLEETVAGLEVEHLEWQERPGRSTIGMLMAHLALAQIGGLCVGCAGLPEADFTRVVRERLGIDTDGIAPMARNPSREHQRARPQWLPGPPGGCQTRDPRDAQDLGRPSPRQDHQRRWTDHVLPLAPLPPPRTFRFPFRPDS